MNWYIILVINSIKILLGNNMGLEIKAPENVILKPIITVFGVGGAGGNAVNNMIKSNLQGANFVVANTDAQALKHSETEKQIQLGALSTKGLGAGACPDVGKEAALESESEIRSHLEGSNMVFITAGMGGGTGTGASPVIAKIAKELGILTVGVVTKPFLFEGIKRMKAAEGGLDQLQQHVDTLIIIPNQNLFRIANENTTFHEAFEMADEVLHAGVRGVTDLITSPGLVNLDFADIDTVMSEKGKAMMGTGEASGEERAIKAAESAIANPLLDQSSMKGACGVLINITGGKDMTLYEVDNAANRIREEVGESDANIIFGSTFNPELEGSIRVSVVATGIEQEDSQRQSIIAASGAQEIVENSTDEQGQYILNEQIYGEDQIHSEEVDNNISLDEIEAPKFNEYEDANESNDSINELQQKLDELMQKKQLIEKNKSSQGARKNQALPPVKKQGFLKRMWSSLKILDEEQQEKNKEPVTAGESDSDSKSDVKDAPDFFK